MDNREYPPLFKEGFKEIGLWELDNYFLIPFGDNEQRRKLIDRLQAYLLEFSKLGIDAELWIDGSFTTVKPEPEDVDLVFLFDRNVVESLVSIKRKIFEHLLQNHDEIKARYLCDVYYIDKNNEDEISLYTETYGFDRTNSSTKGIFKVILKANV